MALQAAAGATLLPVAHAAAQPSGGEFRFVVANDLHYRDARCGEWLERVSASIRALRPRPAFVVLAGDLVETGTAQSLGAVREIFRPLPIPVRSIIGNHDYTEDGSNEAWKRVHGTRLNARFDYGGWQFLALDTTEGRGVYRTRISQDTLTWLDRTLPSVSRTKPLVVLTHLPLGRNWLRPLNARAVLDRLQNHNLQAAFSGHWHGWTERVERGVALRTGRCCSWWRGNHDGSDQKGYLLCTAGATGVRPEFVAVT